jgi:aldehyde dehydrogenase (NAD+)
MTPLAHRTISAATGLSEAEISGGDLIVRSPVDGAVIGAVHTADESEAGACVGRAVSAFRFWRAVPAPVRGELVRLLGEELRASKDDLGRLVSLESGKILAEGRGEVQEMIDICDFAVGLSRQLYGLTVASERSGHHMREMWHPLGPVGIITAFNFPVAVWAWNVALALVCGDPVVWKPSEKTPLTALACQKIFDRALARFRAAGHDAPEGLSQIILGGREVGAALVDHPDVPLVSATGSTAMGRAVARRVAERLGRSLLELGGNNAMIVAPSADLSLAVRAIVFSAVGTAGQRCTTLRRLIVHESVKDRLVSALVHAYGQLRIGSPLEPETLIGPLIDRAAFEAMQDALMQARDLCGGRVATGGERVTPPGLEGGYYVRPAIVDMPAQTGIVLHETFAPILYVLTYRTFDEAIALQNGVTQGLSSCIFTNDVREAEAFVSATGSDCGIANVNIGPSGAEIGGAFGGEKDTGGGRESGSDSWRAYMRRQTQTVNYSGALPLAQGVKFEV